MASDGVCRLGSANNRFAMDLYKSMSKDEETENIFFAPFSIVSALAMTQLGAKESTSTQMKSALRLDGFEDAEMHQTFSEITETLRTKEGSSYALQVANRLFARQGYKFLDEFLTSTKKFYQAEAENVDFEGNTEGARTTINKWVEDQTAQKIKDLFKAGTIDQKTAMILVNAIYFKGDWEEQFKANETRQADFYVTRNETIQVDMMYKHDKFKIGFSRDLDAKSVELPYKGKDLSMICILPNRPGNLADLESKLTAENIQPLLECPDRQKIMLWIPKFKVEHQVNLKEKLCALGMTNAFTQGQANFSGMDGSRLIYLSQVVHKAYIEVNEQGTEAAAATGVQMMLMSMPLQFNANQPFLFVIKDNRSGAIVFMGRIRRPKTD